LLDCLIARATRWYGNKPLPREDERKSTSFIERTSTFARKTEELTVRKPSEPTGNKRAMRLEYYEGVRQGMMEHIQVTENNLRNLEGVKPGKLEKLMADLHKTHEKLLERIDRHMKEESRG
jgi:hypothetical protein